MKKVFCDRCGRETSHITSIKVPRAVSEYGDLICEPIDLCNDCNAFVEKTVKEYNKAMAGVRVSFYETLIPKRSNNNET